MRDIEGEIDHLDKMITALVELLDEKGIIEYNVWESKIRDKIESVKGLTKFEDLKDWTFIQVVLLENGINYCKFLKFNLEF